MVCAMMTPTACKPVARASASSGGRAPAASRLAPAVVAPAARAVLRASIRTHTAQIGARRGLGGGLASRARPATSVHAKHQPAVEVVEEGDAPALSDAKMTAKDDSLEGVVPTLGKMGLLLSVGSLASFAAPGLGFLEGPLDSAIALGVLAAIIAVHEYGHFLAARLQNIHVTKFSIGFGPILAKYQPGEVEYALRAIPLGGFVAFPDDDPDSAFEDDDPNLLKNRPVKDRLWVVSAGVIANVLFATAILFAQVTNVGVLEQIYRPGVAVPEILPMSAAGSAGVREGDVIKSVNGRAIGSNTGSVRSVVDEIKRSAGKELDFTIERGGEELHVKVVPNSSSDGEGRIGVQLSSNVENNRKFPSGPIEVVTMTASEFGKLTQSVTGGLYSLVSRFSENKDQVSGPVAILAVGAEVAKKDASGLFQYAAILNINLAVVNSLPLPALDGGYAVLIALEAIRGGKKLNQTLEGALQASGIVLLMGSGLFLVVRDTLNLDFVQKIFSFFG